MSTTQIDPDIARLFKTNANMWDKAKVDPSAKNGFVNHPDGKYRGLLSSAECNTSQAGRAQVKWEITILEGEKTGETQRVFDPLAEEDKLKYLLQHLSFFGIDITQMSFSELPKALETIVAMKPILIFTLSTNAKGFQNCYLTRLEEFGSSPMGEDSPNTSQSTTAEAEPAPADEDEGEPASSDFGIGSAVKFSVKGETVEGVVRGTIDDGATVEIVYDNKVYKRPVGDVQAA